MGECNEPDERKANTAGDAGAIADAVSLALTGTSRPPTTPDTGKGLSQRHIRIFDTHFGAPLPLRTFLTQKTRVPQSDTRTSSFDPSTLRLRLHKNNPRMTTFNDYVYEHSAGVVNTLTSRGVKFWDLRRSATPRELADLQGFPDDFHLPTSRATILFGNAVAVPVAAHAIRTAIADATPPRTFLDICSGIGGFHCAAKLACPGATCVGFADIMPAAVACYCANFPKVPALGDITHPDVVRAIPLVDMVCAGFPCQPFSRARQNGTGTHHATNMFQHVLRIVRATRPQFVVLENVPQLRTTGKVVLVQLLDALARDGFQVTTEVWDAHDFGLRQHRRRLFIMARRGRGEACVDTCKSRV